MKRIALAIGLIMGGVALGKVPPPKAFSVSMKSPARVRRGATVTSSSTLTVGRQTVHVANDGSAQIDLVYITPAGQQIVTRQVFIAAGCGQVTDAFSNVIAATAPTALCNAITSFVTQVDTTIGNAATGGKLNL